MPKKIAIGLSGGIDSSVAAFLLKKKGYSLTAFTLKFFPQENKCCDLDSLYQAQRLCDKLNIPHYLLDAGELFKKEIIDYFINSYLKGLTPNPCAFCNRIIKFGLFFNKIKSFGIDFLASGHYAQVVRSGGRFLLKANKDSEKTQEYFLSLLCPDILSFLVFPLADYTKKDVINIAKEEKLLFKQRQESQDVCFVTDKSYSDFIENSINNHFSYSGAIKHINGKELARHSGIYKYTHGQRQGLGIGWKEPLYVLSIDSDSKEVTVGERNFLKKNIFAVHSLNLFIDQGEFFAKNQEGLKVKVRYNSPKLPCRIAESAEGLTVYLREGLEYAAPGQVAAFYLNGHVLGAGIIGK
ncbi:MAG: tRNA 2-thiouridine(34) synthase MnmA [Candidatus Omnitrophica bacterium]|nr:tRNA 2-thiouridine(34) synthase MnmA [Candidatus Omnitrophota bacterium]